MLVCELEGLYESQSLIDWASNRQVVDGDLTKVALVINDEQATELGKQNTIVLWNFS